MVAVPDTTVIQAVFQCTRDLHEEAPKLNIISGHYQLLESSRVLSR